MQLAGGILEAKQKIGGRQRAERFVQSPVLHLVSPLFTLLEILFLVPRFYAYFAQTSLHIVQNPRGFRAQRDHRDERLHPQHPRGSHLHGLLQSPVVLSLLHETLVLLRDGAQCMRHRPQLGVSLVKPFFEFDELGSNRIRALQDSVHGFVSPRFHLQ